MTGHDAALALATPNDQSGSSQGCAPSCSNGARPPHSARGGGASAGRGRSGAARRLDVTPSAVRRFKRHFDGLRQGPSGLSNGDVRRLARRGGERSGSPHLMHPMK